MVRRAMREADGWFMCRVGYVETLRAVGLAAGPRSAAAVRAEWSSFGVIEVDHRLAELAVDLSVAHELRSLDALHLAAATVLPPADLLMATWDRRLHAAAASIGLGLVPQALPDPH